VIFVLALVGLSGVGKSTLISELEKALPLRHFTASDLIKSELAFRSSHVASSEELRVGAVTDNQVLLMAAFSRSTTKLDGLVVLDAHVVIDGACGLIDIAASVFGDLGVQHMLFIEAAPEEIAERRRNDTGRSRPTRSAEEIGAHQEHAITRARTITAELGIPLTVINANDKAKVHELLVSILPEELFRPRLHGGG
jgi:adenylate kinase